jgi:hypothetical protein
VVVRGQRRSELEKQCLLTTRERLDCDLDRVWGQDWFRSNLCFKRVSSVSVLIAIMSGVVFSLKRRITLSFTGKSCMGWYLPYFCECHLLNVIDDRVSVPSSISCNYKS